MNAPASKVKTLKSFKVLAIQFKYLGDAVILTPALHALAVQIPNIELHVLVAAEIAPLLEELPWITKVWAMPRERGKAKLSSTLPFIFSLRREKFAQSVDFGGNDRGALMSYLSGAKRRLGPTNSGDLKSLKKICYTDIVVNKNPVASYFDLHFELLNALNIKRPNKLRLQIRSDRYEPALLENVIPPHSVLCHISTSQQKKDWPLSHWKTLYHLCHRAGLKIVFSAGPNERERKLISELKLMIPEAEILPSITNLVTFLNILKHCKILVCGDTGPLHFAEGLAVPVLGIFGVGNSMRQVAPIYSDDQIICAVDCACDLLSNCTDSCRSSKSCMASVLPVDVFAKLIYLLKTIDLNNDNLGK